MGRNRIIGIVIWTLGFALSVFLLFVIPSSYTNSIYASLVFDGIAFISTLILWIRLFQSTKTPTDVFYCTPAMTFSTIYLVIQFIICLVIAVFAEKISFKLALTANIVLMVLAWIILLSVLSAKDHAQRIDSRQKDHHIEL